MPEPRKESLDETVSHSAVVVADQIQKAAAWAKSEMDLQIEVAGALKEFAKKAQIKLEGHHNITIATGRPDSVYGSVIVEYKDPNTLSPTKDSAANQKLIEQLKKRFYDMRREEKRQWASMFGVGTDGKYFIFLRFRDEKWTDQEPLEVNRYSTERFLWALYNLGQKGKPYQPEYLHGDFGSDSRIAQESVGTLYDEILKTDNPRAQVFFNQWKILFGEVCGYDVENLTEKLKKLADFYGVKGRPHPAQLLFALHTYFAVLIKLLAAEIVSFFNPWMPRQVEKLVNATTSPKLKRELEQLEHGGIFHEMGITNFLEGDLFSWYLAVWSEPIEKLIRQVIVKLDEYNPGTFSEDPAQSRDLLKKLYQQLFPKSVRHDLGEYYTPDWLADHVLNELGYDGDPTKRLLDPACGSGTFLVMAINRVRRWYDSNREKCAYDEGELLKKILANVIGFDLNPLAVMAARTNYLVAIKDLIRHVDHVDIPVYLCDSIMTPSEYGDLFTGSSTNVAKVPCSAMRPPHLLVPKEIAKSPKAVAKYAAVLETCVKSSYAPSDFLARCRDEGLEITATAAHIDLYNELVRLDKENKNGIWARIIKNNFAPLFIGKVDYVVGNPPWINWESLPQDYRQSTAPLWKNYNLFRQKGYKAKLGGAKDDISILMTYVAHDCYLAAGGHLGFLITQSVFKTKGAGEGFRAFQYADQGLRWFLPPVSVHDFTDFQPFEGAANRTAALVVGKSEDTFKYPVPYTVWMKRAGESISQDDSLEVVKRKTIQKTLVAHPVSSVDITSPWLTAEREVFNSIRKVLGPSAYAANEGVNTGGLNGCFWVHVIKPLKDGNLLIENLHDVGKIKVEHVQTTVEPDLVFALLRGRDVSRWCSKPSASIILPNRTDKLAGIPESEMREKYPKTLAYLRRFEGDKHHPERGTLRGRALFKQYFKPTDPFYSMYNVGPYTVAPWKVQWKHTGVQDSMRACVTEGNLVGDQKVILVEFRDSREAHYFCACINSFPAFSVIKGYIGLDASPHILDYVGIPAYRESDSVHKALTELSLACHQAASEGDEKKLSRLEAQVDKAAAKLWGITKDEMETMQKALGHTVKSSRTVKEKEEDLDL
jgi:hypothetical protein